MVETMEVSDRNAPATMEYAELKAAWAVNAVQENDCRPLDWMENCCPELWYIDGEEVRYHWYEKAALSGIQ